MQVFGRQLTARDNTALNKVFDTFTFTQHPARAAPCPSRWMKRPPRRLKPASPAFVMKGKTKPEASLRAVLMSFSTSASKVFETKANKAGVYSLPIDLPGEDVYVMTLTVQSPGLEDLNRSYNIRYQSGLIPVSMTSAPSGELLDDQFVLAGSTTESNVRATLSVNGNETTKNVARNGTFSFTFDTKEEGTYAIRLVLTKKGLQDRVFNYTAVRVLSPLAREELLKERAEPHLYRTHPKPQHVRRQDAALPGTLIAKENDADAWVLRVALNKRRRLYGCFVRHLGYRSGL